MVRAMFTDAREKVACPKCHQPIGSYCRYPSGGKTQHPHDERVKALQKLPNFDWSDYGTFIPGGENMSPIPSGVFLKEIFDGKHICLYCQRNFVEDPNKDRLCNDCSVTFGHSFYSEL